MTDDIELAPSEAGDEVVADDQTTGEENGTEAEGDQSEGQSAEQTPEDGESEEEKARKSRNDRRREAKERMQRELREAEQKAADFERKEAERREALAKMPRPKQEQFDSYEEFVAALSAHQYAGVIDGREAEQLKAQAKAAKDEADRIKREQEQEDAQAWESQKVEARSKYPDFEQVALSPHVPITDTMAKAIIQSDMAADLAYHIGKNPSVGEQMASMSQPELYRALGRLEAQLSAPKPKTVTSAPEPIATVRGKATASKDPDKMSPAEYRAWREKGGSF